jgi:integrase
MKENNELTVVKNEVGCYSNDMNNKIISGYIYVKEELNYNTELQEKVVHRVVEKKIVDETEYNFEISAINIECELRCFLSRSKISDTTKQNYKKWLNDFFTWSNSKGINVLKITRMEAENYLYYLCTKYAPNSARSMILSVSSFYSFIENRHEIIKNRFYRLDLPTIKLVRRIDKITYDDIQGLRKELKRIKRKDILCAVDLMEKYGERIGVFENMKIDDKGNWNSVSKESMRNGKFTMNELKKINESGLLKLRKCTIENTMLKYTKKLHKEEKISCPFSCHDIRHYRITEDMRKAKSGEDMIKVSRRFHKNINTTLGYVNF